MALTLTSAPLSLLSLLALASAATAQLGTNYCAAAPNSTGSAASMGAGGSANVNANQLTLQCQQLPVGSTGYYLASMTRGFVANPAGSAGNLCLSQPVGRYVNCVQVTGSTGIVSLPIDLGAIPDPLGPYAVSPGDTVSFQYWHRDTSPAGPTSNFSDGLEIEFSGRCELGSGFFPGARFVTYGSADLIEAADFNGDGFMDVVKNSDESNWLSILLGTGDGRFLDFIPIDLGAESTGLAVGDMDGDGDLDVVTSNFTSGTVSVVINQGGSTFTPQVPVQVGSELAGVDLSDIDGDGDLDVVVADAAWTVNTVTVLRNSGGGLLTPWTTLVSTNTPRAVKLVDLNADGDEDLVIGNDSGTVAIWMNTGGSFSGSGQYTTATGRPIQLDVGDFNGDGHVDLAVANSIGLDLLVMFGAGDGTFSGTSALTASAALGHLDAADIDGDGDLDLIGARASGKSRLEFFEGLGDGTFLAPVQVPTGRVPRSVVAVDLYGAPGLELVAPLMNSSDIIVITRDGNAGFHTLDSFEVGRSPDGLVLGDVNGDGNQDFVVASSFDDTVSIGIGRPDGSFQLAPALSVGESPIHVALGDVDADGDPDLAVANYSGNTVTLYFNRGGGVFDGRQDLPTAIRPGEVAFADVDEDGDVDLVVTNQGLAPERGLSVFLNNGAGTFQQQGPIYEQGATPGGLDLVDLDQDGHLDAVFSVHEMPFTGFTVMPGNGQGLFSAPIQIATDRRVREMITADLDGDGDADVVTLNEFTFEVFENLGGFSFAPAQAVPFHGIFIDGLAVGDIDLDGHLDVVTMGQVASVFLGGGDLTWGDPTRYGLGFAPGDGVLGDIDGDGRLDILATERIGGSVTVIRNLCQ
jgi:hypothetical protein